MPTSAPPFEACAASLTPQGSLLVNIGEACGLRHDSQVIELEAAESWDPVFAFQSADGRRFPAQLSHVRPGRAFAKVSLEPFEKLSLTAISGEVSQAGVSWRAGSRGYALISNEHFSLEVPSGLDESVRSGFESSGPVRSFCIGEGSRRGKSFFDTRQNILQSCGEIIEEGPIRIVYRYSVRMSGGGFYEALITVDSGQCFAAVEERFDGGCGDQVVWDFSGADLPAEFLSLDSGPAYRTRSLSYHFDLRLARLAAWTQQSQHLDFVDGFALPFSNGDVAGFVTLDGGAWRGAKLNHMEAWVRRWLPGQPSSRRDIPADAKADSYPGPERVAARGGESCEAHFNVEGWIGKGVRRFALVLAKQGDIRPINGGGEAPLGHFDLQPDRDRYRRQQSLLRKIHIQRGVLPLQTILDSSFSWPLEDSRETTFAYPNEVLEQHLGALATEPRAMAEELQKYIAARVYGFWEGSGIAYSNPVVSRRIAPEMFRYEWLVRHHVLSPAERDLVRAHFAFLITLFSSENYYTGDATMLPAESPDSTEPTLAGMANQNFYTDAINVFGVGAQVFHRHPQAAAWRERFIRQWHRQLEFHMYPESGLWEESHTYYQHVLHTVLPAFLRRAADGVDNEFANPAMQKLVGTALKQVTPCDAGMENLRYLIAFGDHGRHPQPALFAALASAFRETNRELAGQLSWLAREMGGGSDIAPIAPAWVSEAVQGLGVMFRGVDYRGVESLLALRSGQAWGHHHNDDGSIQFYAMGQALVVDSAFGGNQANGKKVEARGHSRWSLRGLDPVNYYWRFNRGWVTQARLQGRFPFAVSHSPVFTVRGGRAETEILTSPVQHSRSVVQIDATTYLIIDRSRSDWPQVVRFHLSGRWVSLKDGRVVADFPGGRLRIVPLFATEDMPVTLKAPEPTDEPENSTTEALYDTGSFAAFLLHAGEVGETLDVASSFEQSVVRARDWEVEIRRTTDGLAFTDLQSGERAAMPLQ